MLSGEFTFIVVNVVIILMRLKLHSHFEKSFKFLPSLVAPSVPSEMSPNVSTKN